MTEKPAEDLSATGKDLGAPRNQAPHGSRPGAESTDELREIARRRRETEEKLQLHLAESEHKTEN